MRKIAKTKNENRKTTKEIEKKWDNEIMSDLHIIIAIIFTVIIYSQLCTYFMKNNNPIFKALKYKCEISKKDTHTYVTVSKLERKTGMRI